MKVCIDMEQLMSQIFK